ncbi:hypothetical protein [Hymenobacter psychrophilus]|uniref:Uncharacterized protein n=1 Tax=Hymenobacter psychrophilus TaxID=651662 RepID=A0A1H3L0A9_9BACT|nr:hypothetical protein [Hymenobacter psychrophilus]SDY57325.1 hypothetical protein SAMN04488069_11029 [Hymenobacter psychrophilus]
MQIRYGLVKTEGTTSFFQIQFRVNQEDEIFCTDPDCDGYVLAFSYPSADGNTSIYSHYIFPNSFTGIYTKPDLMPLEMSFSDGSKRYFDKEKGFSYTTPNSDEQRRAEIIYCCVDNRLKSNPTTTRCSGPRAYRNVFDPSKAITVQ